MKQELCWLSFIFNRNLFLSTEPNPISLTEVNGGNVFPGAVNNFVTWPIPVQDGGKWFLVNITQRWSQTCD